MWFTQSVASSARRRQPMRRRFLRGVEQLENRQLLALAPIAVDDSYLVAEDSGFQFLNVRANDSFVVIPVTPNPRAPLQNPNNNLDVNADGSVSAIDAMLILGYVNTGGSPVPSPGQIPPPFLDVNGDGRISNADAGLVISALVPAAVTSVTQGSNGEVRFTAAGVQYRPNANFFGTDTFTYTIHQFDTSATATVMMTVAPINDPPVNGLPQSVQRTVEDTAKTFSTVSGNAFSASDVDDGNLQVVFTVTGGQVSLANSAGVTVMFDGSKLTLSGPQLSINTALGAGLTFTPAVNFSGTAMVVMTTSDQGVVPRRDVDVIRIVVSAVNDAPVNTLPAGLVTDAGAALTINSISLQDVDAGSRIVQTILSVTPGSGVLQLLNRAGVTVTNLNPASIRIVGSVAAINAALGRGVRFTPAAGFVGQAMLTMVSDDRGNSGAGGAGLDTDSVTVQVRPRSQLLASRDEFTMAEDSGITALNVLANDTANAGAILVLKSFTQPANGVVSQQGNLLLFTPAADFHGTTTFTYTINDSLAGQPGGGLDATATVTVTVTEVNDEPNARDDILFAGRNTSTIVRSAILLANDFPGPANEAHQTLRFLSVSPVSRQGGTVMFDPDTGVVTYTPPGGVVGAPPVAFDNDSFTYVVSDDGQTNNAIDFRTARGTVNVNFF